jgi:D-inositol-3-phosphate glycosyltransferase
MSTSFRIAMLSIHSSPVGPLGTRDNGGMSVYVRETARWLAHRGHTIDIYTCATGRLAEVTLHSNVRLIHLGRNRFAQITKSRLPLYLDAIFDCLEQYRVDHGIVYDLVHSHYWLSGAVGTLAAKHWCCPHLTMFHTLGAVKNGTTADENEPSGRLTGERLLVDSVDGVVAPAEREKQNLIDHYRADPEKIHLIPCGVDLARFQPKDRDQSRARLGLDIQADVLIYVGRFAPVKGLDALVGAVALLRDALPALHLMVVGGDGLGSLSTRAIQKRVCELHLQNRISFVGRIDQSVLPYYYSAADLLALPSHYESFGLVVLEALACGTPVLATPVGAMESIIRHGVNGAIVQCAQSGALAKGIAEQLAANRNSRSARKKICDSAEPFGWGSVAEQLESLYLEVCQGNG